MSQPDGQPPAQPQPQPPPHMVLTLRPGGQGVHVAGVFTPRQALTMLTATLSSLVARMDQEDQQGQKPPPKPRLILPPAGGLRDRQG